MNHDLQKTHDMISSGMQKVKQLRRMVSETKQSLIDQKRLQYLENMYREKMKKEDEKHNEGHKLTFEKNTRRL